MSAEIEDIMRAGRKSKPQIEKKKVEKPEKKAETSPKEMGSMASGVPKASKAKEKVYQRSKK